MGSLTASLSAGKRGLSDLGPRTSNEAFPSSVLRKLCLAVSL